jgi:hypothetical protein
VQVVQNLRIIPAALHPRCRIPEGLADYVGEVVYVPVFDAQRPHAGPVAVLEALLSSRAADAMLVATFISYAGTALATFKVHNYAGTLVLTSMVTSHLAIMNCFIMQRVLFRH